MGWSAVRGVASSRLELGSFVLLAMRLFERLTGYVLGRHLLGTYYLVHNPTHPGIMNQPTRLHHRVRGFVPTVAMLLPLAGIVGACSNDSTSMPTAIAPSSPASFGKNVSGSNQKILFSSTRDGNHEVYSINPDGTGETRLTNDVAVDQAAVWSPDGKRIAFHSTRDNYAWRDLRHECRWYRSRSPHKQYWIEQ